MKTEKKKSILSFVAATLLSVSAFAQEPLNGKFTVGLELGEIPFHGSFKPGIAIGFHWNDYIWTGLVYQIPDSIKRDGTSFNANAIDLDGLLRSSETVGQRFMMQARLRPHRYAPYLSVGAVFNDTDTETIVFDDRARTIGGEEVSGPITVVQSRPAGGGPSLGLGYSLTLGNGLHLFTEWAGYWMAGAPKPDIEVHGNGLTPDAVKVLKNRIIEEFTSSPFNTYHMFQLGAGYAF